MKRLLLALGLMLVIVPRAGGAGEDLGFAVPPGFEVTLFAGDALAHDIFCLTFDAQGRVVVAGPGYVKTLHDDDQDGRADRAVLFSDVPKSGAHGMVFDGPDLIANGDLGVRRYYDRDGDGKCDDVSDRWCPTERDQGHAANGLVRGPDGWYYMITGNSAGITSEHAKTPNSPVKKPVSGAVVRFSPDGKTSEIVAHGYRNAYDLAFNPQGQMFTVDSDGERVFHLPWYTPTRLFDISQGMWHGWVLRGWRRSWAPPESHLDNVERLVEIGRGSPTGVQVYRHRRFPQRYRRGVFSICWTFGRIYFFPLRRRGATYDGELEIFMETTGDVGFAPTDMAVSPAGDLYVSIGGRGTRGSVFRVRYQGEPAKLPDADPLRKILLADQPQSSWSRAAWVPKAKQLGRAAFERAAADKNLTSEERIRAIEILTELFNGVGLDAASAICGPECDPEIAGRIVWSLSRSNPTGAALSWIAERTREKNPLVQRAAWEALAVSPLPLEQLAAQPDWSGALSGHVRRVRAAAVLTARGPGKQGYEAFRARRSSSASGREQLAGLWIEGVERGEVPSDATNYIETCLSVFAKTKDPATRLDAVRLMEMALGDVTVEQGPDQVFCGYLGNATDRVDAEVRNRAAEQLAPAFPTGEAELDRELARLLAMLGEAAPGLLDRLSDQWSSTSTPADDVHYLLVSARLPGHRSTKLTRRTAASLAALHAKLADRDARPADQWTPQVDELTRRLMLRDPKLAKALVENSRFGHPGHTLFAHNMPVGEKQIAARKLLAAAERHDGDGEPAWTPELVKLIAALPADEELPALRKQWNDPRLTDSILLELAAQADKLDRQRFFKALGSTQPAVVRAAAGALIKLDANSSAAELLAALRSLRRWLPLADASDVRQALADLLVHLSGEPIAVRESGKDAAADYQVWFDWFGKTHPRTAAKLVGFAGQDAAAWRKRLAAIDWQQGDAQRGKQQFARRACFRCHAGERRLGPGLEGVAQRFARNDLFATIVEPAKDISPLYRTTQILTTSGKAFTGILIYESTELCLLQTTPDATVRIPGPEIERMQPGGTSFMPKGLLNQASDRDLADLYAYLKTLRKK